MKQTKNKNNHYGLLQQLRNTNVYSILSSIILAISWRLYFVVSLIGLVGFVFAVLAIIGIINSLNGKAKELPLIGKYKILK